MNYIGYFSYVITDAEHKMVVSLNCIELCVWITYHKKELKTQGRTQGRGFLGSKPLPFGSKRNVADG